MHCVWLRGIFLWFITLFFIDGLCLLSHKLINLKSMICFTEVVCTGMKAELRIFMGWKL